jgi:type II secretory pathway component GspD/PulD (secretin)
LRLFLYSEGKAELTLNTAAPTLQYANDGSSDGTEKLTDTEVAKNAAVLRRSLEVLEQCDKVAASYANLAFARQNTLTLAKSTRAMTKQEADNKKLKEPKAAKEQQGGTSSATWHPSRMFN